MSHLLIDSYLNTYDQLAAKIEDLTDKQLNWKASATSWSVTEVLTHLADHSLVISFRLRDVLAGTQNRLPIFDQDKWIDGQHANEGDAQDVLAAYQSLLHYNSLLLKRLSADDWQKSAANFKGELISVIDIIESFILHVQNHLAQIDRINVSREITKGDYSI